MARRQWSEQELQWNLNPDVHLLFSLFAQCVQHDDAAESEASYGAECGDLHSSSVEMKGVGEDRDNRKNHSQNIEPQRRANRLVGALPQPKLQQYSCEPDGGNNDKRDGTVESGAAGVDHDQSQRKKQKRCGKDGPAMGLGRLQCGVRHGVSSEKLYSPHRKVFNQFSET